MPSIVDWTATTNDGKEIQRGSGSLAGIPADTLRQVVVDTDSCTRLRAVVRTANGERLSVWCRRAVAVGPDDQSQDLLVPYVEIALGDSFVRLYIKGNELVLTTEDLNASELAH